jgi:hypothetical protein
MSSKDVLLGVLLVVVVILAYLFLTQGQVEAPTIKAPDVPTQPPPTQPTQPQPSAPQQPEPTQPTQPQPTQPQPEPTEPEQPTEVPPTTEPEANDTDTGPIILIPINVSEEGNGTLVRIPPTSRNATPVLISIYPTRIAVDPYDFLNDPFDFSNLQPTRSEGACKNQCDYFCLAEKNNCKDKCDDVHDDVCLDAAAQSLICKAACLQADSTLWDMIDCGMECKKELAKACSWFTVAKCKGQCGSLYYNRCKDECYDTC